MGFVSEPITPDPLLIDLPRRPVLTFWVVAVALEVLLGVAFLATGADAAIEEGLAQAGLDFSSDLLTAVRVVVVYLAALASWHFPVKFDAFLDYGVWGALAYLVPSRSRSWPSPWRSRSSGPARAKPPCWPSRCTGSPTTSPEWAAWSTGPPGSHPR